MKNQGHRFETTTFHAQLDHATTAPSPEMTCWLPERESTGIGLIIFPGGGYGHLAVHEGEGYARHFSQAGIACFVVAYRLGTQGHRHPAMLEDAWAALATVRARAAEFGVDPGQIGVIGSSAGGHLAAHTLVAWPRYRGPVSVRPDFGVLCYPVTTALEPFAHKGCIRNLLGDSPSPECLEAISCDRHVTAKTPPCFLWHTGEDTGVPLENSLIFASALRRNGVPFELHLYQKGRHGLGLGAPFNWADDCLRWMREVTQPPPG
jgi:acetyl esterase/lipase